LGRVSLGGGEEVGYPAYAPCTPGDHTIPAYTPQLLSLGGPQVHAGRTGWSALHGGSVCVSVRRREAQEGEIPWVGESFCPKSPKSVTVGRRECAELFLMYSEN